MNTPSRSLDEKIVIGEQLISTKVIENRGGSIWLGPVTSHASQTPDLIRPGATSITAKEVAFDDFAEFESD